MKSLSIFILAFGLAIGTQAAEKSFDFSESALGETPTGFKAVLGGAGSPGEWKIIDADVPSLLPSLSGNSSRKSTQRALAQLSKDPTDERFPILIYEPETYGDFTLSTQIKMVDGAKEQMAGIAFRFQDVNNYYYVRASALGGTLYFFKVVGGVRSSPIGIHTEIPRNVWHELTVECRGNKINVRFNGKEAIPQLIDKSFTNGKIGFWTKSDSISQFASAHIQYVPREILAQSLVREAMTRFTRLEHLQIYTTTSKDPQLKVVASSKPEDLGTPGTQVEKDVLGTSRVYQSKISQSVTMTLPLHDANGEPVAAVRVVMRTFPGETEKTAVTRAVPVVKMMEARVRTHEDLVD